MRNILPILWCRDEYIYEKLEEIRAKNYIFYVIFGAFLVTTWAVFGYNLKQIRKKLKN